MEVSKSDWALFRAKVPQWQENYMDRLVKEYIALLSSSASASDNFWELEKRIRNDKKSSGVLIHMSRSDMYMNLLQLLNDGAITLDDLTEFSDDVKESMKFFLKQ